MKRPRVMVFSLLMLALVTAFFFLPLPVSRVRQYGLVQVGAEDIARLYVPADRAVLKEMYVRDGQAVLKNQRLLLFISRELEDDIARVEAEYEIHRGSAELLRRLEKETADPAQRLNYQSRAFDEESEARNFANRLNDLRARVDRLLVRAPRDGVVMSPPKRDELDKQFERDSSAPAPVIQVGDPGKLFVLIPVAPPDMRLLREEMEKTSELPVSVRLPGRGVYQGRITRLPEAEARQVPVQLTQRGGGGLAVKPSGNPNELQPQSQQFLVLVEILGTDHTLAPGAIGHVKIHCSWRSAAWWTWRKINSLFDLGLI